MRIERLSLAALAGLALSTPAALAQAPSAAGATPSVANPSVATTRGLEATAPPAPAPNPAETAGIAPAAPPVQVAPTPSVTPDIVGQEGFFRPLPTESAAVPAVTPLTPGLTPMDTRTTATVGSSPTDQALREAIAGALANDPSLQGASINVTVQNGVVNVTGSARDSAQAARARAVAQAAAGSAPINFSIAGG